VTPSERICVALDFPTRDEVLAMARRLGGRAGWLKVGLEAFTSAGPSLVHDAQPYEPAPPFGTSIRPN